MQNPNTSPGETPGELIFGENADHVTWLVDHVGDLLGALVLLVMLTSFALVWRTERTRAHARTEQNRRWYR